MNDLSILNPSVLSMTSREIAELTGKDHSHVLRDIRALCDSLKDDPSLDHELGQQVTFETDARGYMSLATMQKDFTLTLLTGYDHKARFKVIKRWQELEARQVVTPMLQRTSQEMIESDFRATMGIMSIFELPKHIAQQEAVKEIRRLHGVDYSNLLVVSPAQNVISDDEVMLEPNDLAKELGFESGAKLNKWLEALGKQVRVNGAWAPTEAGLPYCVKHAWNTQYKTGYNLKWNLSFVKSLLTR
jgi:phage regulator Rha-like protein